MTNDLLEAENEELLGDKAKCSTREEMSVLLDKMLDGVPCENKIDPEDYLYSKGFMDSCSGVAEWKAKVKGV